MKTMNETRGLWRAKRLDNREWVNGYYVVIGETHCIFTGRLDLTQGSLGFEFYKVDPSTLGECTGLRDKNKKLIFEGDIVKIDKATVNRFEGRNGVVKWLNNDVTFALVFGHQWLFWNDHIFEEDCEIIGNIYDNPELLERVTSK